MTSSLRVALIEFFNGLKSVLLQTLSALLPGTPNSLNILNILFHREGNASFTNLTLTFSTLSR